MTSIDLSVYITTFNRPKLLLEAVESIECQGVSAKNIIVLDNNSDASMAMISVKNQLKNRVTWKGSDVNNDAWWNFERAFLDCQTEFMMVFHDDDRLVEDFLEKQSLVLISDPLISAISCNGFKIDIEGLRFDDYLIKNQHIRIKHLNNSAQVGLHTFSDSCIPPSPMIYRTSVVKKLVMILKKNSKNFGQTADVALNMLIADAGILVLNMEPLYECRVHENQDSSSMLLDSERYLRNYSMKHLNGDKNELRMATRAVKSNYTYSIIYSIIKSIIALDIAKLIKICKCIDYAHLSPGGLLFFYKVMIEKVKIILK
jgi:glycosyltransferase involved in cell wall biosynthesis